MDYVHCLVTVSKAESCGSYMGDENDFCCFMELEDSRCKTCILIAL